MQAEIARRIAENEATFRDANEQIEQAADELDFRAPIPFVCECGEARCRELVKLTREEYSEVRASPTTFFVVPGHEDSGRTTRVVEENAEYQVVEKLDEAAEVAEERDPRS